MARLLNHNAGSTTSVTGILNLHAGGTTLATRPLNLGNNDVISVTCFLYLDAGGTAYVTFILNTHIGGTTHIIYDTSPESRCRWDEICDTLSLSRRM